jgi:hypothetical protein
MRFRLVVYNTTDDNKYKADTDGRHEFLGNREAIWFLWFTLTEKLGKKHVEVFSLDGTPQKPELGFHGMSDYNV